jgi:hypothetical protein
MEAKEDARIVYADIIDLPHHRSELHAAMPMGDRAAQFSAYDALAGYFDMIAEEERFTDREIELDESALALLDEKLAMIADRIEDGVHPWICFTVFVPDERKSGGRYEQVTDRVWQIDGVHRRVILESRVGRGGRRRTLDIVRIAAIHGDTVDRSDERV